MRASFTHETHELLSFSWKAKILVHFKIKIRCQTVFFSICSLFLKEKSVCKCFFYTFYVKTSLFRKLLFLEYFQSGFIEFYIRQLEIHKASIKISIIIRKFKHVNIIKIYVVKKNRT